MKLLNNAILPPAVSNEVLVPQPREAGVRNNKVEDRASLNLFTESLNQTNEYHK